MSKGILVHETIKIDTIVWDKTNQLSAFIKQLQEIESSKNFTTSIVEFDYEIGYYDSVTPYLLITTYREETDEEYSKRLERNKIAAAAAKKRAAKLKEKSEAQEKELYEKLKKKYDLDNK